MDAQFQGEMETTDEEERVETDSPEDYSDLLNVTELAGIFVFDKARHDTEPNHITSTLAQALKNKYTEQAPRWSGNQFFFHTGGDSIPYMMPGSQMPRMINMEPYRYPSKAAMKMTQFKSLYLKGLPSYSVDLQILEDLIRAIDAAPGDALRVTSMFDPAYSYVISCLSFRLSSTCRCISYSLQGAR
ncbi:hypothetical protein V8C34DRAFT_271116 [Trichoderma compactum]